MTTSEKKKPFGWKPGDRLDPESYDALGHVRDTGFTKLADGVYADPALRKKERKRSLNKNAAKKDLVMEESVSGLTKDYTPSEASKIMGHEGSRFKGILGYTKSQKPVDKTPKK